MLVASFWFCSWICEYNSNQLSLNVLKTQAIVVGSQPKIKKITDKIVDHLQFLIGSSQDKNRWPSKIPGCDN